MGQPLTRLIDEYIGAAAKAADPEPVLRDAAQTFARLALDPHNVRLSTRLGAVATEFAKVATMPRPKRPATISDFEDLLDETHQAVSEVGDEDSMAVVARRREIHEQRSRDAPRVSISPGSFNEDATLGRAATIKFNPTEDEKANGIVQSQTVAFWQGTKKEAQAITIDIGMTLPPAPAVGHNASLADTRPYALVDYGSDGNKTTRKFDVGSGTRVTVPGNYVSVIVGMDPPMGNPALTNEALLTVGASLGTFAAPSVAPVIATGYIDNLAGTGGTSALIQRPLGAAQLLPIRSGLALGETALLEFLGFGGATVIFQAFYQQSAASISPIVLSDDVWFVRVTNNGAGPANFRLPFQLSM